MEFFHQIFDGVRLGLEVALTPSNLVFCTLGVSLGMLVGVLPGIGSLAAISLLFPVTYYLDPTTALIMLGGMYYGSVYGGSVTAIMLNLPGTTNSTVTCLDGHPLAKQGRPGAALILTTLASFIAGCSGILLMMFVSPLIVDFALSFGTHEYVAVIILGLTAASAIAEVSLFKSLAMLFVGFGFGFVGLDPQVAESRFTFGMLGLAEGIALGPLCIGLFGVTELITSVGSAAEYAVDRRTVTFRSMIPRRDDLAQGWKATLRGTAIGSFFGALPGTGATISSFMAYAVEKRIAKDPSRFGKGAIEGICAPEAANNAADQTAFIPTMTLGIPGSAVMAVLMGVLLVHGITPGPSLMVERPEMFWGLVMSFWIGNVILMVLNIPMIGVWIRMLTIPYRMMFPGIVAFVCIGAYAVTNSTFDVLVVAFFGVFGYLMRLCNYPPAPLILGFVLGPMLEVYMRRSLVLSQGDFTVFLQRPISASLLASAAVILGWSLYRTMRRR